MSNIRNILYYSKKCKHSIDILNTLSRNANILNKFDLIDIASNKPPEYVKAVPTLLIPKSDGEADMLVGKSVFNWLNNILRSMNNQHSNNQHQQINNQDQQMNNQQQQMSNLGNISDFDPCTMNGFSDNFSFLGNENNGRPIDHNFSFLNSNNNKLINEQQFSNSSNSNNSNSGLKVKSDMEKAYERMMQSRDSEIPSPIQRC